MNIGGLQPVTLLDYPQKVAAIIFTQGCNMRCPFCYNPGLVLPELIEKSGSMPKKEIDDFLNRRHKYLDGICITGGEPLVQSNLIEFCQKVKGLGLDVKIDTNGLLPDVMQELVDKKLVDYIAMDIKGPLGSDAFSRRNRGLTPSVASVKKFCGVDVDISALKKSIHLIKKSGLDYEFRSTLVKGFHRKKDIIAMAKSVLGAKKYYLQNFSRPGGLIDDKFKGKSFHRAEMRKLAIAVGKYVKSCEVR